MLKIVDMQKTVFKSNLKTVYLCIPMLGIVKIYP